jgi:hypothetical protein
VESGDEQRINNKRFTKAICKLFSILKACKEDGVVKPLRLGFPPYSVILITDKRFIIPDDQEELDLQVRRGQCKPDIFARRFRGSFLSLLQPGNLPVLANVHHLKL